MKITAIKQQVKQQGRYSIFVEGKYSFSLSDVALLDSKLIRGQELTEQEVRNFQKIS
jgi:regulatory protein